MKDYAALVLENWAALGAALHLATGMSTPNPPQTPGRNPILLIHGYGDSGQSMVPMKKWFTRHGWNVFTLNLVPSDGSVELEQLAKQVASYIEGTFPAGEKIDLVGFSMGGIVCRCYVQQLGGTARVDRLVTVSAPHHGTWLAYLSGKPGCVEMRPASAFLNALNRDAESLDSTKFYSIWTPLDLMILPSSSSRMNVGSDLRFWTIAHSLMILQSACFKKVETALLEGKAPRSIQHSPNAR